MRHYDGAASQPPDSHASRPVPELQQNSQVWQCAHVAQCVSAMLSHANIAPWQISHKRTPTDKPIREGANTWPLPF